MRRFIRLILVGAFLLLPSPLLAQGNDGAVEHTPIFDRMLQANTDLHSYQSRVHLSVTMHTFPFISHTLDGTVYFKAPDRNAIEFDDVPALASLFKKIFPKLDPPATWPQLYRMTITAHDDKSTTFHLEPRKNGTIESLNILIDNKAALPIAYTYNYRSGGYVHFDQTLQHIGTVYVTQKLVGHVELSSTVADATSTFDNYHINAHINNSVFDASPHS